MCFSNVLWGIGKLKCNFNLYSKSIDTSSLEPTNQNSIKVPKAFISGYQCYLNFNVPSLPVIRENGMWFWQTILSKGFPLIFPFFSLFLPTSLTVTPKHKFYSNKYLISAISNGINWLNSSPCLWQTYY